MRGRDADEPIGGEAARHSIMISAGEASGDAHAAHALAALAARGTRFTSFGMGAGALAAGGTELVVDGRDLAVIGIVDVLLNYPKFLARLKLLREAMRARRPDLLVIVDYPDFNLKLAETARELDIPVLFYISPQIWAWRANRVHRIGALVTHMAVLFPFEVDVYERAGVPVTYVGHPLVDDAHSPFTRDEARVHFGLDPSRDTGAKRVPAPAADSMPGPGTDGGGEPPVVTLLPGSRSGEIRRHLPPMLESARRLRASHPGCRFLLPLAPTLERAALDDALAAAPDVPLSVVDGDACHAMRAADVVLAASGTATLETALIGTPLVVLYIVAPLNHAIMRRLIRIPDIALVNVVAGRRVVPEFVQHAATPDALAGAVRELLDDPARAAAMREALADVRERMGEGGASARVAGLVATMLERGGGHAARHV